LGYFKKTFSPGNEKNPEFFNLHPEAENKYMPLVWLIHKKPHLPSGIK
jgi:hypothetical protein